MSVRTLTTDIENGLLEKKKIAYPQIASSEYSLYQYTNGKPTRIEEFNQSGKLEHYIINEYDSAGNLIKETTFGQDKQPFTRTGHIYKKGLNVQSDVFVGQNPETHKRRILRTFDGKNNLTMLESQELSPFSSASGYVLRYEYFEK